MHNRKSGLGVGMQALGAGVAASVILVAAAAGLGFAQPTAAPAPVIDPEQVHRAEVVAQVGTTKITVGQLEDAIRSRSPLNQQRYNSPEAVRELLDQSLRFELLADEALRRGYPKHPAVTLAVKQNIVQMYLGSEFEDKITTQSVPAEDVKKYYDTHLDEFVRPESRRGSMVIVATEAAAKALLAQTAKMSDVRAFRELARTESVDESNRQRGGDLGYFDATGHLLDAAGPNLDGSATKAAFALKEVGDLTSPVRVGDRFAIIKLTGIRAAQEDSLHQADERIRMRLWRDRRQAAIDAKLSELKQRLHPEVHPELADLVQLDTGLSATPDQQGQAPTFPQTRPGPLMTPPSK